MHRSNGIFYKNRYINFKLGTKVVVVWGNPTGRLKTAIIHKILPGRVTYLFLRDQRSSRSNELDYTLFIIELKLEICQFVFIYSVFLVRFYGKIFENKLGLLVFHIFKGLFICLRLWKNNHTHNSNFMNRIIYYFFHILKENQNSLWKKNIFLCCLKVKLRLNFIIRICWSSTTTLHYWENSFMLNRQPI